MKTSDVFCAIKNATPEVLHHLMVMAHLIAARVGHDAHRCRIALTEGDSPDWPSVNIQYPKTDCVHSYLVKTDAPEYLPHGILVAETFWSSFGDPSMFPDSGTRSLQ